MGGMKSGHLADRFRSLHAIGTAAAMHVQIDETRQDPGCIFRQVLWLNRLDQLIEHNPARDHTRRRDYPPRQCLHQRLAAEDGLEQVGGALGWIFPDRLFLDRNIPKQGVIRVAQDMIAQIGLD